MENKNQVETAIFAARDHAKMRLRKRKEEEESYRIAREAVFSWKTEKEYRKDPVFDEDEDEDNPWWQKPELSKEKKLERMRAAEREVKFQMANKKQLLQQNSRTKFYSRSDQFSGFARPRLPYFKPDGRRCHICQGVGHLQRFCPLRFQQNFSQNNNQQLQFSQGKPRATGYNQSNTGN